MADLDLPNNAERVAAILTDPGTYFEEARKRALRAAETEVAADLRARAAQRDHNGPVPGTDRDWR